MTTTQASKPMVLAESVCKNFGALRVLKGIIDKPVINGAIS